MAACVVCNKSVRRARVGATVCGARACQRAVLGPDLRAAAQQRRQAVVAAAGDIARAVNVKRAARGDAQLPLAIIPSNDHVLTRLPADTRQRFTDLLAVKVARTVHEPAHVANAPAPDLGADTLLNAACATCRGYCCIGGGEHAHLDVPSLARVRTARGFASDADMMQAYAHHLPRVHYQGSCVYHAAQGCTLPRDMRADICNRHLCASLTQLTRAIDGGAKPPFLAIAADRSAPRRSAVISAT